MGNEMKIIEIWVIINIRVMGTVGIRGSIMTVDSINTFTLPSKWGLFVMDTFLIKGAYSDFM